MIQNSISNGVEEKDPETFSYKRIADLSPLSRERKQGGKALLISAFKNAEKMQVQEHLKELAMLAATYGIEVAGQLPLQVRKFEASTFLSLGKIEEVVQHLQATHAKIVIFDEEISPAQQRNLEAILQVIVMDRTEIILGVFADHAKTKEAKLQIELAQIKYQFPRLKRLWTHLSRQSGGGGGSSGGGYLKGEGEKQIEIDRRILKTRIERLEEELQGIRHHRTTQRILRERSSIPVFAIVGYTNAGKSTLMNALTQAEVLVEDKLFATLDTTTRKYSLPNKQEILLIDTVGFIRKLPHLLVASFKSTLEEAIEADILIHLIDSSHSEALEQAQTTIEVLHELGAKNKPIITVFNKIDKLNAPDVEVSQRAVFHKLKLSFTRSVEVSSIDKTGIDNLVDEMVHILKETRERMILKVPQDRYHIVSEAIRQGFVYKKDYEENNVILDVELPKALAGKLDSFRVENI